MYSNSVLIFILVVHDTLNQNKDKGALINKYKFIFLPLLSILYQIHFNTIGGEGKINSSVT